MKKDREELRLIHMNTYEGCIMDQVAASQLISSKLCSMLKPIEERQSKLPSPSTY